jgi:uncharacterized protein YyaL (SSP411 family)
MANRLVGENSGYLLQHKNNPVDWYPWGKEALKKARNEDKPIFLSIGYSACHWCHVMEQESFEDTKTAQFMNEHFINIKVDREERPDLDRIYMNAVMAITGQGGWPLSVFLTPGGEPFFGGTYFPPVTRYGIPAFQEVLKSVSNAWKTKRDEIIDSADELTNHIRKSFAVRQEKNPLDKNIPNQAAMTLAQSYDWENGGWGKAQKFPQAMVIRFLLQRASRGDKLALDIATHALRAMAKGGMYDVIGGGFARYSIDEMWLVPHFEKMLYDNALLSRDYLYAYTLTKDPFFRKICEETLDFAIREMTHEAGGFYSSLDADSEGEEGKYYVWSFEEIKSIVEDEEDIQLLIYAYGLTDKGNFEGNNILQRVMNDEEVADKLKLDQGKVIKDIERLNHLLFKERRKREPPKADDKVLISWNAWMTIAFSEAARYLHREDYLKVARDNLTFIMTNMYDEKSGRLYRSWRVGKAQHNAYLEDYASLILAFLSLYQSDFNPKWFQSANTLTQTMINQFSDPSDGFFDTNDDHEVLLVRPKEIQDNATPSGNSLAAEALLLMAAYTGKGDWYDKATVGICSVQEFLARYPSVFGYWLCAIDIVITGIQEIAIIGEIEKQETQALISVVWERLRPYSILAQTSSPVLDESPPLLQGRIMANGKPSAYICQNMICDTPTISPQELQKKLAK